VKLFLDDCISPRLAPVLQSVLDLGTTKAVVHHFDQLAASGTGDDLWVPRAAEDGYVVVTKDSGRKRRGPPLQLLLPAWNIPAIFCYRKLNLQPSFVQASAIVAILPGLVGTSRAGPPKGRYRLKMTEAQCGPRFSLEPWPLSRQERDGMGFYGPKRPPAPGQMF
jgi:hypothetical protein